MTYICLDSKVYRATHCDGLARVFRRLFVVACLWLAGSGLALAVTPPLLQYHMDETSWAGIPGEVTDSSGSGYNGMAVNGATTANTTPALAGNPGTCGYGVFDGQTNYVALPNSFPNLTTNFTITAWIRTTNNANGGQRILIDDQNNTGGYGFSLGDGGTGKLRFYARGSSQIILDTANVISSNTWYFVAAVADISNAIRYIYVYDATGALVTSVNVNSSGWGIDNGAASIGGENNSSAETGPAFHFAGNIDEVQVFNGALTQTDLNTLAVQTHPCGGGGGTTGCIPTTINGVQTPVMGGTGQVQIDKGTTVNGTAVANNNNANSIAVTGVTTGVTPALPALVPANFPTNNSNTNTSATTIAAGSYNNITTGTAQTTFTGGTYYINNLTANGPITLGAGTYYINNLSLNSSTADITVTGAVQIFIGNSFDVRANNISVNAGGSVANLQVNFYPNAQLDTHGNNGFSFTGVMYAPDASTQLQIDGNNNTLTGVLISGGQVQLNNTAIIYGATQQNQVATMTTMCSGGGGVGATAGSFNAFETSTAANSATGLLYTKLAGTAFAFDVVAIQTNGTAIANTFAGTVKVELVDASTGAACAAAPLVQSVGTITFATANAGRMTAPSTTVATAWPNVRVRMTSPATGTATTVACSTDNFAIRPSSFTVTASAVPALGATIKVGSNFNFTATSNVSSGYTGTPAIVPASVFVDGTTTPITATNLVGAFAAATGAAATGTFQYNELGTITLNTDAVLDTTFTSLDQTSGGCVPNSTSNVLSGGKYGCNIGSAVFGPLGRFIPDHFDTVVTQGCNTTGTAVQIFTYSGQPFTATITARGAATATPTDKQMTKYAGTYAKNTAFAVPANGAFSVLQALNTDFVSGVATKTLVFVFTTLPSVPAPITIRATDTDGVTSLGATEGAVNARVGRFNVANAVGADLYPLSVPWAVQYYNTNGWITNSDDTCTIAPATSAIGLSNYKGGLSSTSVTAVTLLTAVPATASNGAGIITLAKPSPKLARSGSVWVSPPTLPSWLQPGVAGLATFSIFNGAKEFIYMRENY